MNNVPICVECGNELTAERAELGYTYCTREDCQARRHRGLTVTAVGVNKSADTYVVGDPDEIRRRGETGEFGRKDSTLGLDYRAHPAGTPPQPAPPAATPARAPRVPTPRSAPARRPWTAQQEKIVTVYHGMGLNPRQIAERARQNVPRLAITERLATRILSATRRR